MPLKGPKRVGAVVYRGSFGQRLNAWRKRTPFNPYWLDWKQLRQSVESLREHAHGTLLDVGVSEGPYREYYAPAVERYIGLEYPPSILDKQPDLWNILDRAKQSVDVFGDGNQLAFKDGVFDTVLSTEVLEHLPTPATCIAEMARVLKPGGKLLLTVPFSQPLHELPNDFWRFTPSALALLARDAGLEPLSVEPRGNFATALGAMSSQWLLRSIGANRRQSDGSVILSRWRSTLLLPLLAMIQLLFHLASKITNDTTVVQGYALIARKPAQD
ncbi:MAG: ubiquinone/menaquinone biosynthesis C-methylase UbiE [Planctomycetota bacterium]|jgi:ubiquinone/menaquinone biosynthesis C-methylase UbiE